MTNKATCVTICKRGKSKIFEYLWEDIRKLFGYDENFCKAAALQVYFRKMNSEFSFDLHEVFYQKQAEYRKIAWNNIMRGIKPDTIDKNDELLNE